MEFYQIFLAAVYVLLMIIVYAFVHLGDTQKKSALRFIYSCTLFILGGAVILFFKWLLTPISPD